MSTDPSDNGLTRQPFSIDSARAMALYALRPGDHLSNNSGVDLEIQRMAQGGFGLVFLGFDHRIGEPEVLKTLRPELLAETAARGGDPGRLAALFVREALVWAGLWPHPNLLQAQFATQIYKVPFLVLDYAPYGNLRDLLTHPDRRGRPLPLNIALRLVQQIAAGLVALHTPDPEHLRDKPLVHRDLKPENILLHELGFAQITDFGLAKAVLDAELPVDVLAIPAAQTAATEEVATARRPQSPALANIRSQRYQTRRGAALGTLAYMAPEQWVDAAMAGPPADMYAFGLILSELFAGRGALLDLDLPHSEAVWRATHAESMPRALREVTPTLPGAVEALYRSLLAKPAEDRPTAEEALAGLQATAAQVGEAPYSPPEITPHTAEHERLFWQKWATTHWQLGLHNSALERIERALAWVPNHYEPLLNRGAMLADLGRYTEAMADNDTALATCPLEEIMARKVILQQRGTFFTEVAQYPEAEAAYSEALAMSPEASGTWYNRAFNQLLWARAETEAGQLGASREHALHALAFAERALALNSRDPEHQQFVAITRQLIHDLGQP